VKRVALSFPCGQDFSKMTLATATARRCEACDVLVQDLSAMTEGEAEAALAAAPGRLCVRYLYDETGEVWFKDQLAAVRSPELVPIARLSTKKRALIAMATAAATLGLPMLTEACGGAAPPMEMPENPPPSASVQGSASASAQVAPSAAPAKSTPTGSIAK
jgi:hypothetical protein